MSPRRNNEYRAQATTSSAPTLKRFLLATTGAALLAALIPTAADAQDAGDQIVNADPQQHVRNMGVSPSADPTVAAINRAIASGAIEAELAATTGEGVIREVRSAYARNAFQPIWTSAGTDAFRRTMNSHSSRGLVLQRTDSQSIARLAQQRFGGNQAQRAQADIELTAAYVRFASAVADAGNNHVSRTPVRAHAIVDAGKGGATSGFSDLAPKHPQYVALENALDEYREIHARGGWLAIPEGKLVNPGDRDPRMPALRARLEAEGYDTGVAAMVSNGDTRGLSVGMAPSGSDMPAAPTASDPTEFDQGLVRALMEFQRRHGLEQDGVIGPNTLEALNESVESKIDRLSDNMEKWRVQGDMGVRYVWANIPSFTAEGWNNGRRELSMRTIVGQPDRQTPVFSDQIEFVVPNPRWYAPVSIVRRDKLPKLAKDPGYANRGNYHVYDRQTDRKVDPYSVNWNDPASAKRYKLVQMPGDNNALGKLKILFPNQYSVYMHGTPGVHLFNEAKRTFSSGCVRLEDPLRMAQWIAQYDMNLDPDQIAAQVASGERKWMKSDKRTPVHITYFTVTEGEDGDVYFWRDVYKKDDGIEYASQYAPLYTAPVEAAQNKPAVSQASPKG